MADPYASIAQADKALQVRLATVLELRAADPQQRAMLDAYLSELKLPSAARALEVGCGTGAAARVLAELPSVQEVVGIDPSPIFIQRARELARDVPRLSFDTGDARALPAPDSSFDLVVLHTTLCHIPEPEKALREAQRVLRPGGCLAVFDGDYPTTTVANGPFDPLQAAADAMVGNFVQNPWLTRGLKSRGADLLVGTGRTGHDLAESLKSEARRVQIGQFFGHMSFVSVIARH